MNFILIISIVIILILILVIFYTIKNNDSSKREKYKEKYNSSSGNFDQLAKEALDEILTIKDKTPDDSFRAGNIIEYNILQGNLRHAEDSHPIPLHHMISNYNDTLRGIQENKIIDEIDPIYMIDHIEMVYNQLQIPPFTPVPAPIPIPEVRKNIIKDRKRKIKQNTENKKEEIDTALEASKTHTVDPQNVHDSGVNADLRKTIKEISETYPLAADIRKSLKEIRDYVRTNDIDDRANKTLLLVEQNHYIMALDCNEAKVLSMVWERAKHEKNKSNSQNIREAIINALIDCIDPITNNPVCINGRCGRYLESLTLLDFSKNVGRAQTSEMYKNEIFNEARILIDEAIKNTDDATAAYYKGESTNIDPVADKKFKNAIYLSIDNLISKYVEKLPNEQLENIRIQCRQALD